MNTTKKSLFTSLVACFVLLSMLMGTTFAWFTDIVSSENNVIQSGSLKAEMYWSDKLLAADSDEWIDASAGAVFNHDNWEPGYTQVRYVKVVNNGSLKFKWQLSIAANGKVTELSDAIDVYYVNPVSAEITSLDGLTSVGTLTDVLDGNTAEAGNLDPKDYQILAIAFHMDEYAGNEYQDMSLCEAGFSLKLIATQATGEFDSFDDQYDADAEWPYVAINYSVGESVENKVDNTSGTPILTESVTVGEATDDIYAEVPAGVQLADGVTNVTLSVNSMEAPTHQLDLERGEVGQSIDVHMEGVAPGNTVPIKVSLDKLFSPGLNPGNAKMFHIENGTPVAMTRVESLAELDAHNEFYYDVATGDVVMSVATFSEYEVVENDLNNWEVEITDYSWYSGPGKGTYEISSADQLAAFGRIVDGTAEGYAAYDFDDQTVVLTNDINMGNTDGDVVYFNPIGFGYDYKEFNSKDENGNRKEGKVFRGTFDGQNNTISNLNVNGWEIGTSYSNSGGGLFASVCDATIKNLTMSNANIVMECVEQGVIAGLAQGTCTFENIKIYGCSVANYQRATGGVVGEVSPKYNSDGSTIASTHTFKDVEIDSSTVIGSLWGDFDAPVGGVIGARWDDSNNTTVVMNNVKVACRLDVYNDVTSAYQWYAYRRAGMLIGNTDMATTTDGRTVASADFLECQDVLVIYGSWVKYHYCEFTNQDTDKGNNYPWVRVEAGENCSAFSNPRYGQPLVDGANIKDTLHTHEGTDEHLVELTFNQLYGGGQGVYGNPNHTNVEFGTYTVTYVDHGEVFHVDYATETYTPTIMNTNALSNYGVSAPAGSQCTGWMDNHGKTYSKNGGNSVTSETILYPVWSEEHFVMCFDTNENLVYSELITGASDAQLTTYAANIDAALAAIQEKVDHTAKVIVVTWDYSSNYDSNNDGKFDTSVLKNATADIILKPKLTLSSSSITLTPYPETGETEYYMVTDVNASDTNISIEIPAYVGTVPVTVVSEGAFDGFDNLHAIKIPNTVTTLEKNMFPGSGTSRQTITIYYEGTKDQWNNLNKVDANSGGWFSTDTSWDNSLGKGSRVFFLGADGKVDISQGYLEVTSISGVFPSDVKWTSYGKESITQSIKDECTANCGCDEVCKGEKQRPDAIYWEGVTIN